ncbi:hypothetical protein RHGRI_030494 [Rhododendron griersonianum]|uniref:Aconitase A/isopropylmalate dehydratase small subunit swivel domain-containing protein n=1 Tax=Rhododendron griersonianum TaxID=479676 RepID=A0AAV6IQC0_9ERIC|nr:hypothetical protein RHGRI_030494 [Rhododendron griersonianum]
MFPPGPHGLSDRCLLPACLWRLDLFRLTTSHWLVAFTEIVLHAAKYLMERGVDRRDIHSYGSRRGNHEVMMRGTFANVHLWNKLLGEVGPKTIHIFPVTYKSEGNDTIILAGAEYGTGSSRDWAAKGPMLLGVKAVIAKSFESTHRSNLVGMGIIPLCFKDGEDAETLGLTGRERYTIDLPSSGSEMKPGQDIPVSSETMRSHSHVELAYFDHGGVLHYAIRKLLGDAKR